MEVQNSIKCVSSAFPNRLNQCNLSKRSGWLLASELQKNPSHLRELDMSVNDLQDEGMKLLCEGLKDPKSRLEKLRSVTHSHNINPDFRSNMMFLHTLIRNVFILQACKTLYLSGQYRAKDKSMTLLLAQVSV